MGMQEEKRGARRNAQHSNVYNFILAILRPIVFRIYLRVPIELLSQSPIDRSVNKNAVQ